MLGQEPGAGKAREPARTSPEPPPGAVPVNDPEKLSAYEILGLSPLASAVEIKRAYRKRVKDCHPDLFAAAEQHAGQRTRPFLNGSLRFGKQAGGRQGFLHGIGFHVWARHHHA